MTQAVKVFAIAAAVAMTTFLIPAQQRTSPPKQTKVTDAVLRNAAKNADEWVTYGRDYSETHFSPLKQIDASNVKRLGLGLVLGDRVARGSERVKGTPLMSNGSDVRQSWAGT